MPSVPMEGAPDLTWLEADATSATEPERLRFYRALGVDVAAAADDVREAVALVRAVCAETMLDESVPMKQRLRACKLLLESLPGREC
ncbi:MAG: hypothetical protein IPN34_01700 [Planctomycetes bacterium]|nr:hypothetical protein [Planctomycetota bacterium]